MLDAVKLDGNSLFYLTHFIVYPWFNIYLISFKWVFAGTCWHLRRLDWCEEVGEPLMDEVSLDSGQNV